MPKARKGVPLPKPKPKPVPPMPVIPALNAKPASPKTPKKTPASPGSPIMELDEIPTPKPRMAKVKAAAKLGVVPKTGGNPMMPKPRIGTKLKVWNGNAERTPGGLIKADLMLSPRTKKVISKKQFNNGKARAKNLGIKPKY